MPEKWGEWNSESNSNKELRRIKKSRKNDTHVSNAKSWINQFDNKSQQQQSKHKWWVEERKKNFFLHHSNISFSNKYGFYDVNNHVFHHRPTICRALFFSLSFIQTHTYTLVLFLSFFSSFHSFRISRWHTPSKRKMSVKWIIYNALSHMINWISKLVWSPSEQSNSIRNWMTRHWYSAFIYQFLTVNHIKWNARNMDFVTFLLFFR